MSVEQPIDDRTSLEHEPELNKYFKAAIKTRASDLHLKVGQPPKLRLFGELKKTTGEVMSAKRIEELVFEILSPSQKKFFLEHGTLDFAYELDGEHRFRTNLFRQRGMISLAARRVNSSIPPFKELHLPPVMEKICEYRQGLILVVGPTGCGKTTTIASLINYINLTRSCHIVTIEDPIEYLFKDEKAIVSQREIGIDVKDFEEALTYLMRQDPDVVFVGEMRDARTVNAGMRAAETGHLVFGTLHSSNAAQAVHRLLDLFPQTERDLVRQTLSLAIRAIISQALLPCLIEGVDRIPAMEILLVNAASRKLIAEGREADLSSVIRGSQHEGMQDLTYNLCELVKNGSIDPKDAYKYAPNIEELKMALKGITTTSGGIL
ncbi:MAG: PilT/PilU family type 4a pilus ATPase [Sedimentisphaerales bacterium]|nr:PilT/PilU family type 4a pilus ATPase [Sedimentisphaerales bacterium]